ncbi:hypothetical protein BJX70DRAFT_404403 [Aspergillus crustosus]
MEEPEPEQTPRTMTKQTSSQSRRTSKSTSRPAKKPAATSKSRSWARPAQSDAEKQDQYSSKRARGNNHDVMETEVEYITVPSSPDPASKEVPGKGKLDRAALSSVGARRRDKSLKSSQQFNSIQFNSNSYLIEPDYVCLAMQGFVERSGTVV